MQTETIGQVHNDPFVRTSPRPKPLAGSLRGICRESRSHEMLNVVGTMQGAVVFRSRRRAKGPGARHSTDGRLPALHLGPQREAPRRQAAGSCPVASPITHLRLPHDPVAGATAAATMGIRSFGGSTWPNPRDGHVASPFLARTKGCTRVVTRGLARCVRLSLLTTA